MKVIDDNNLPERGPRKPREKNTGNNDTNRTGVIYLGVILMAVGLVWLLYNFHVISFDFFHTLFSWQMLLIAAGGYLLATHKYVPGAVIAGLGVVFLIMNVFDVDVSFSKIVMPLIVIAIGVALLIPKLKER